MNILDTGRTLVLFLLTFTLIVAVHEFGHYLTARLLGMKVLEYAIGFGPRLGNLVDHPRRKLMLALA